MSGRAAKLLRRMHPVPKEVRQYGHTVRSWRSARKREWKAMSHRERGATRRAFNITSAIARRGGS